jgi:Ca2+-binding RTX toxin-like protein
LSEAQVGKTITVSASYTDGHGTAESVSSSASTAVLNVNDGPTGSVTVSGTVTQGQTLTATNTLADVDGLGTVSYQWKAGGSAITGATGNTLRLSEAQVGKTITVSASYTDGHGTAESVSSSASTAVLNVNDVPTGSVTVAGTAKQGQTLTATNTLADVDGLGAVSYQWKAGGVAIAGATASTLVLSEAQVGKTITVSTSYTDGHGTAESVNSAPTNTVMTNGNNSPTGNVMIAGMPVAKQTLTASNSLSDIDGMGVVGYQWQTSSDTGGSWINVTGATASTLVLTDAMVGRLVRAVASYKDGNNKIEVIQSGAASIASDFTNIEVGKPLNLVFIGDKYANSLVGADGNDILNGKAGADTMMGGRGDDTYVVDNSGDVVLENANAGTDTIQVGASFDLKVFANVENVTLTGLGDFDISGNDQPNLLIGNKGKNQLQGYAGADTLNGGKGADTLIGGTGDDTYYLEGGDDVVKENDDGGHDTIVSSTSNNLSTLLYVEDALLTGKSKGQSLLGNALNNSLTGNSEANTLDGGAGADTLAGGAGNDIYIVDHAGDTVIENSKGGVDTVKASASHTLSANVENLVLTGPANINGKGNDEKNTLDGNDGNNVLQGGKGDDVVRDQTATSLPNNNVLDGGEGKDTLTGGYGHDIFSGGKGDDVIDAKSKGGDIIFFNAGDGKDTITGQVDTLSLGSGIRYNDLKISKSGSDLVLEAETSASVLTKIVLKNGYSLSTLPVKKLQFITFENAADLSIPTVRVMDFNAVLTAFMKLSQAKPSISVLGVNSTTISNTQPQAYGGDLALYYAKYGNFENMQPAAAQQVLLALGSGGDGLQTLHQLSAITCTHVSPLADPLVLDLDGNGIETSAINAPAVFFDHAGTGIKVSTGWIAPQDGLLTLDRNGNGVMDDASELFSDSTPLFSGGKAASGFAALAQQDGNGDGVLDAQDVVFNDLRVWQDSNQDGQSQLDELKSLFELGIARINVGSTSVGQPLTNGNQMAELGSFAYADGRVGVIADVLLATGPAQNHAPVVLAPLANQSAKLDELFQFHLPAGSFADQDVDDHLSYSVALADGGDLPTWLNFDPLTQTFFGLPSDGDVGVLNMVVSATDASGTSTSAGFALDVARPNRAPVASSLADQSVTEGSPLSFVVPQAAFVDPDLADQLTLEASLSDGAALPDWLVFDAATGAFSGTPGSADTGRLDVRVTAMDRGGLSASGDFALDVGNIRAQEDLAFSFTLSAATLTGAAAQGDAWAYTVTQADGAALPSWLAFDASTDASTLTFSGTPTNDDVGIVQLVITASDMDGQTASKNMAFAVVNTNDAPQLTSAVPNQVAGQGEALSLRIPENAFQDADLIHGDALDYRATLAGGTALPAWLSFDADTKTLTGTPGNEDVGCLNVLVTATDSGGLSASSGFTLEIANLNDAPITTGVLSDQTVEQGAQFNFTIPGDAFQDADLVYGDALAYSAALADGTALPAWLSFDATTRTLTGTPGNDAVGYLNVLITATDGGGLSTSSGFTLEIANLNDAPVSTVGLEAQSVEEGEEFSMVIPEGTFTDLDIPYGDSLSYTAALSHGAALPSWLNFDGKTQIFSGTPNAGDLAQLDIVITATDAQGLSAQSQLTVTVTRPQVNGSADDDTLLGTTYDDHMDGLAGNDTLDGAQGSDVMDGGAGNDIYVVDNLADVVLEGVNAGNDTVYSSVSYALDANIENLILTGDAGISATGNALNNTLVGNTENNLLDGGTGVDTMSGGLGNDVYVLDSAADVVTENAGAGTDTVKTSSTYTLGANIENLTLLGSAEIGGSGNALNNVLDGSVNTAANLLMGGAGNDTYILGAGDTALEISSTGGVDTVMSFASCTLGNYLENLTLVGVDAINGTGNTLANILTGNAADNMLNGGSGTDTLVGGLGNDSYVVNSTGDVVIENAEEGTDTVQTALSYTLNANVENLVLLGASAIKGTGNALDNVLDGSANTAANVLTGGMGNDSYILGAGDTVVESVNEGADSVVASATYTLGANLENLTLAGGVAINATGNTLNNLLIGNVANNILDAGAGADTMSGGLGNDIYIVDNVGDWLTESAGAGLDAVQSSVTFTLGANFESLMLTGANAINATGNELDNVLTGNNASNLLDGGAGADTMSGGLGNDIYVMDNAGDVIVENADAGWDTVQIADTYKLNANFENLTLIGNRAINGTGNELDNCLIGNAADNVLDGGTGGDAMSGGAGNDAYVVDRADELVIGYDGDSDTLIVGDQVTENADQGVDTVTSWIDYTLTANVENLSLLGVTAGYAGGNDLNNVLVGNSANNTLDGAAGADSLTGGLGNDVYWVDNVGDIVTEAQNEGIDKVYSAVDYTLAAALENLTLTGGTAIYGTGNALDNVLAGNSLGNVLAGGLGDDVYVVQTADDVVVENADAGVDTVTSNTSYSLSDNVENLVLSGSGTTGVGNDLNNVLSVSNLGAYNAAKDTLNGGAGADTMTAGYGDDTYYVDNVSDVVIEHAGQGGDTVMSTIDCALGANLENLTLTGSAALTGVGNELDNVLQGNGSASTLMRALGNDTYLIDNTVDTVIENVGQGSDTVVSSISYVLGAAVENLTLTGTADINGSGNDLDNLLTGNSGANTLVGGLGNDTYYLDNVRDAAIEDFAAGVDTVQTSLLNYTLAANIENLRQTTYNSATTTLGNELNNVLTVTESYVDALLADEYSDPAYITSVAHSHVLDGGAGADTMTAGGGDNIYYVDNVGDVVVDSGVGVDTIYSSVSYALAWNVENMVLSGTAQSATGNGLKNVLTGNAVDNWIDGGGGADTMTGGAGNDTYVVNDVGDVVAENTAAGVDTVRSSIAYTLGSDLENLTLLGSTALSGTGNVLDNVLDGSINTAANVLSGGAGNDTYVLGAGDTIVESASAGTDTVVTAVTYTLGSNLENLTLSATAAINGTGNTLNNVLTGNVAANTLSGGSGNDTLNGGAGSDSLVGGTGSDSYLFGRGYGIDTVSENDTSTLSTDLASFASDIHSDQLWFSQSGYNLEVAVIGTSDKLVLSNWYLGKQYHVEQLQTGDGKTLLDSSVQNLVQAMASFSPPAAGQTTLSASYASALSPVIAANWH